MKVLVAGGAGFIGSFIVEKLLESGFEVRILDSLESGSEKNLKRAREIALKNKTEIEVLKLNILDQTNLSEAFKGITACLHLAGLTSPAASLENTDRDFQINVVASQRILEHCWASGVKVLVYASSAEAVYGRSLHLPIDERAPFSPLSPVGASKGAFETYLSGATRALKEAGKLSSDSKSDHYFTWVSLRLPAVFGPRASAFGENNLVPVVLEALGRGLAPTLYCDGNRSRDYVHVIDVADAFVLAVKKGIQISLDEAFNVSSGFEIRDLEVFEILRSALKELSLDSDDPLSPAVKSLKVTEPKFAAARPFEIARSFYSAERIMAFLGWKSTLKIHDTAKDLVKEFFAAKKESPSKSS